MLLVLANGVFAAAEIAVVSLRPSRLRQLVDEGRHSAQAVAELRAEPERFLATVQVGITVVSTTAAAVGGADLARQLEPALRRIPGVEGSAPELALATVVIGVSYLSLVLGELVPKSLALRWGEGYALLIARPLHLLSRAARPVVWLLTASSNAILRPFSDRTDFMETRISKEELKQMVEEATETGEVAEEAGELASRALGFDRLPLGTVMIPRNRIDAVALRAPPEEQRRAILAARRSRTLVYDPDPDDIVGYVSAKDILARTWDGRAVELGPLLRPVKMFPETVPATEVLQFMRREQARLAIAVDEHGAVSGMVTFEDLMEELVGNVFSEHEEAREPIARQDDGTAVVQGQTPIRDVNRELALGLEEPDNVNTIGGLCSHLACGLPNPGARLAAGDGSVLVVLDATARAVGRVRLIPFAARRSAPPPP
ncbi:hemolysin family protein [Nannocystis sp. RBIL2]|uniref:hemolysin family protein n=1 Tax=Nannocystis sp. RBIL2 TaxID=2996788 RepID=UPI00226EE03B|nr:hemolysin family protein [Nannocystis sp. RBIL2]